MGKGTKAGDKGKKKAAGSSEDGGSKGKGKSGQAADGLGICTYSKAGDKGKGKAAGGSEDGGSKRKGKSGKAAKEKAAGGSEDGGSKGKENSGKAADGLGTCTYVNVGDKGKGKAAGGSEDGGSKGKEKSGKAADGLGTCTYVKARHILCEEVDKINEVYKKLQDGWLENGDKVLPAEFAKVAEEYSECPSRKIGGNLGWFPRGKMPTTFEDVAFATPIGAISAPFKST